jgi:hypothetical protein
MIVAALWRYCIYIIPTLFYFSLFSPFFSSLFSFSPYSYLLIASLTFSPTPDCLLFYLIFIFAPLRSLLSDYDSHSIYCLTLFLSISISVQIKRLCKRLSIHILIEEFGRGESMNPYIAADTRPQLDAAAADELRIQANIEVNIVSYILQLRDFSIVSGYFKCVSVLLRGV